MKHEVRTFNKNGKCVYVNCHRTADKAYEEYQNNIRLIKKYIQKGDEATVVRLNDGYVMAIETIKG
jgi:selenophosphate synthetase-related protein